MVLSLRTPTFRNFTFAELREDVVIISNMDTTSRRVLASSMASYAYYSYYARSNINNDYPYMAGTRNCLQGGKPVKPSQHVRDSE